MPLPFSHIVYADKILQEQLKNNKIDTKEYFIGATYPDIRYLVRDERKITHPKFKNSQEILDKTKREKRSFELGLLIHWYIDKKWEEYWLFIFNKNKKEYHKNVRLIEFLGDQILYDKFDKNKIITTYFNKPINQETNQYDIKDIERWHQFIKKALSKKINYELVYEWSQIFGVKKSFIDEIIYQIEKIENKQEIIKK